MIACRMKIDRQSRTHLDAWDTRNEPTTGTLAGKPYTKRFDLIDSFESIVGRYKMHYDAMIIMRLSSVTVRVHGCMSLS